MKSTRAARVLFLLLSLLHLALTTWGAGARYNNVNRMPPGAGAMNRNQNLNHNMYQNQNPYQNQNQNLNPYQNPSQNLNQYQSPSQNPNQMTNNAADTREEFKVRQDMSRDMGQYMNLSADPCTDFYEYACGNWLQYHTRQLREGALGTAQQLVEERIVDQLLELLKLPLPPQHHPNEYSEMGAANVRKVRNFYDTCIATEANAGERRQFLLSILRENGGLKNVRDSNYQPTYKWLQMLADLRKSYGLDILIGFSLDLNLERMRGNSIYLGEPRLTIFPPEHCNALAARQADEQSEIYEQLQQQVAENMHDWFDMEHGEAARFAGDLVRFEFELCKGMREPEQPQPPLNAPPQRSRTGQDRLRQQPSGSSQYPRISPTELTVKLGNSLDFKMFVETIADGGYVDYVYLRSPNYLEHLVRTAKANNRYTISGYILYLALLELNQPPEEQVMHRPRQCVRVMQRLFPQVLGDMYQRYVRQNDAQNDIRLVFDDLIKAFGGFLEVEWLSGNDRHAANNKLNNYHTKFPDYQGVDLSALQFQKNEDYWHRLKTTLRFNAREQLNFLKGNNFEQPTEDRLDAFEVRAALVPQKHEILVGWGLLQTPYYSYYYPKALKYALLGQRMASALLLAFDDEGWNKPAQATSPWSEQTMSGYRNVSECQRAQYSNYLSNEPSEFHNATRLRQIIAESGALNLAFKAYLGWLEQVDHNLKALLLRETLPEMNFTSTQLFFIYFAQTRCWGRLGEEPAPESLPLAQHTSQRWDVNGPLSNSEEFGREFGCALGSPMNSGNKCLIF